MRHPDVCNPLAGLRLDDSFTRILPADPLETAVPRPVSDAVYSYCMPTPVAAPRLLAWSADTAALLGLPEEPPDPVAVAAVFSGNHLPDGMRPYATCYGGHQFGQWAGQLGDGRAHTLGTVIGPDGVRQEVQLKGAGLTPYSRFADGRAVLRSSVREYLCSEAMHHLGIPTTRALCLVGTGEGVVRDMFYDGRSREEPGAIVTRVAPSFLRIGHYEILAARHETALLQRLLDYTVTTHFPELGKPSRETCVAWFDAVCERTAELVARWLAVGFVHGVMNTDNLSVLGLTIDYGPYGWLDVYEAGFTPNTSDQGGRYCFGNQPRIAGWNLNCLANVILAVTGEAAPLEAVLERFGARFEQAYLAQLRAKLGLPDDLDARQAHALVSGLFACFEQVPTDMTIFLRRLGAVEPTLPTAAALDHLGEAFYETPSAAAGERLAAWLADWQAVVSTKGEPLAARRARMDAVNPWLIPRNWLAQQAITAAEGGDMKVLERLMRAVRDPYTERAEFADLAARRPAWASDAPGCSALSCSS